jgi:hypothetical protein
VAPKAAKWVLVGPVLTACGGQEDGLSEFPDSLSKHFVNKGKKRKGRDPVLGPRLDEPYLFSPKSAQKHYP